MDVLNLDMSLSPSEYLHDWISKVWIISIMAFLLVWRALYRTHLGTFPLVTGTSRWDISRAKAKRNFSLNARGVVKQGLRKYGASQPFRVISDLGETLILPPSMANDIRNDDKLSFAEYMKASMCVGLPGFEPFHEATRSTLLSDMVKTKLTQSLNKITKPLSDEASSACNDIFSDSKEWHGLILKDSILDLVARLSARVFLGDEEVSHDAAWLRITKEYTVNSFMASHEIRSYPQFLRPIIHWFLPRARLVRSQLRAAESIIGPVIARRRAEKASIAATSPIQSENSDSIEWLEQLARTRKLDYQAAALQLNLAISAIHTTTDLLTQTMYQLMLNPEFFQPLREEIASVLTKNGELKHSSLYNLELMDSAIKEAQRLKPPMSINMNRVATENTRLPNGTVIPKGAHIGVSSHALWDPDVYPNPEQFDGRRFLHLRRRPGNENSWQLTTTRPEHIAFGHGKHACPGRFLAANEIKIALCHLLLKYDWKLNPTTTIPMTISHGIMLDSDPNIKVMLRRRQPEIILH